MPSNQELMRRLEKLERTVEELKRELANRPLPPRSLPSTPSYPQWEPGLQPVYPQPVRLSPPAAGTCNCPTNAVCMNVACPRAARVYC